MKISQTVALFLTLAMGASALADTGTNHLASSQSPVSTPYRIVSHGENHRTWQKETCEREPNGQVVTHVHKYTELGSGLYYQDASGQWQESQDLIETCPGGAIARRGQYQVIFANNLNTEGAIDLTTKEGKRLRSNILGLAYYDSSTSNSVVIAQIQDSQGELISDNQVLYPNAFGGVSADVRYTYKRGSFEQDVILRSQPPTPESLGLNPATTTIEVMTEFIKPPRPTVRENGKKHERTGDQDISWDSMKIGRGKAFDVGGQKVSKAQAAVSKRYMTVGDRQVLLEMAPLNSIQNGLRKLPLYTSIKTNLPFMASKEMVLPKTPLASIGKKKPMQLAMGTPMEQGFVLDYVELVADQTDFTFQGDTTYCVNGDFNLSGTTTIEGGAVIKFNTNNACVLNVLGTIDCKTGPYRPAVFTSQDDLSVGEVIPANGTSCAGILTLRVENNWGRNIKQVWVYDMEDVYAFVAGPPLAAGSSTNYSFYAGLGQGFDFWVMDETGRWQGEPFFATLSNGTVEVGGDGSVQYSESGSILCTPVSRNSVTALSLANGGTLHDLRFSDACVGIASSGNCSLTNIQFVNCNVALQIENAQFYAGNILMSGVGTGFYGQNFQGQVEQLTFDQGANLTDDPNGAESRTGVNLVNSLLTGVVNYGVVPVSTTSVINLPTATGVYQTAGGGCYYLVTNSPYHNAGSTSISPSLLAELSQKTTYPPIVYLNNVFSNTTTFGPQVSRDNSGMPDLGYHYEPLDYVLGADGVCTNVLFSAGTSIGLMGIFGVFLYDGANLSFSGTATQPCHVACTKLVQEGYGDWSWACEFSFAGSGKLPVPQLSSKFTKWSSTPTFQCVGMGYSTNDFGVMDCENCEFYSAAIYSENSGFNFTNCLFWRSSQSIYGYLTNTASAVYQNCTFFNGGLWLYRTSSAWSWTVLDSVFDGTAFMIADSINGNTNYTRFDYNVYDAGNTNWMNFNNSLFGGFAPPSGTLETIGAHDLTNLTTLGWQSGALGDFYLPPDSPLINAGSTTADQVGLYHFTTQTNQTVEGTSIVDIGYHYVATDASGNPLDDNSDGVPDYVQDANGNGLVDNGEILWMAPPVIITQPANAVALPGGTANFSVMANSAVLMNYQWYFNGQLLAGMTNALLTVPNVQATNVGYYDVVVSNPAGSVTSTTAALNIALQTFNLAVGGERLMALTTNGDVVSWGGNLYGELGDYTHVDSTKPVHVVGLTNVVKIAASLSYALAVDGTGQLWAWGALDSLVQTNIPVALPGMTNVIAISTYSAPLYTSGGGGSRIMSAESNLLVVANSGPTSVLADPAAAVKTDGTVWMWGSSGCDDYGSTPMQITGISNVMAVAVGNCQTYALVTDGTVWAWGFGNETPWQVSGASNIIAISTGRAHTLALDSSGLVWAWGVNYQGQLGDGGLEGHSATPILVPGLSNIVAVAAGENLSLALDAQSNVWIWGYYNTSQSMTPVQVGLTNIVSIAAGSDAALALDGSGNLWQWGVSDTVWQQLDAWTAYDINWRWADANGNPQLAPQYTDFYHGQLPGLVLVSGNQQVPPAGSEFAQPLVVRVNDLNGNPLSNAPVSVEVISGSMELRTNSGGANLKGLRTTTDGNGQVSLIGKR